ncbi:MAG: phosphoribosylamine--glycine ligase, partial [Nitrosopumilaceae archaeon]|nr:phosphoribosylamine--glycine ligase [Nitrosopumilaceae archaeon]
YPKNEEITGLDLSTENVQVFHAGTKNQDGKILTNGGRVLGVTALGDTLEIAIENAYTAVEKISWTHKYFRKDIGKKGLAYL